ncbi:hypothetical protein [Citricoccus sp. NR2]|uniref:hypothetical protein n=1 Tax=Citricoccus sp. NR2 TaxID=3004095 RepID=UPI0022DE3E69|nr:hypothetical protein [Citricoccus sp. NR2]WBL19693.1 hypothetical protein O1A05_03075 [Citricoccus sp. NR2]
MDDPTFFFNYGESVGNLKQAAIDAYMRSQPGLWVIHDDHYQRSFTEGDRNIASVNVSRPGSTGDYGGQTSVGFTYGSTPADAETALETDFAGYFDQVRQSIDQALTSWKELPNPADLDETIEQGIANASGMLPSFDFDGGSSGLSVGELPDCFTEVNELLAEMKGETVDGFQSFMNFQKAALGRYAVLAMAQVNLTVAQQELWKHARRGLIRTIETASQAFRAAASSSGGDFSMALQVLGWAAAAAAPFTGGTSAIALATVSTAAGALATITSPPPEEEETINGDDYDSVLAAFSTALGSLSSSISSEEQSAIEEVDKLLDVINNPVAPNTASGDMTGEESINPSVETINIDSVDITGYQELDIDTENMRTIWGGHLTTLCENLDHLATEALGINIYAHVTRPATIGNGPSGAAERYYVISTTLNLLLKDASWDVDNGAIQLEQAIRWLIESDDDSRADLEAAASRVDDGSSYDYKEAEEAGYGPGVRPHPFAVE